jgi:hypothetical protein
MTPPENSRRILSAMKKGATKYRVLPSSNIPKVIPPRSWVILAQIDASKSPDWVEDLGRIFRIGFYNPGDGLDCIWLVNSDGEYEQTVDRKGLLDHFVLLKLSDETDLYGQKRRPLKPLGKVRRPSDLLVGA